MRGCKIGLIKNLNSIIGQQVQNISLMIKQSDMTRALLVLFSQKNKRLLEKRQQDQNLILQEASTLIV
jgi:hypothetical protein